LFATKHAPGKIIIEASPAGYTPEKAAQRCSRTRWSDCVSDLAWPRLGVESAELSEIVVDHEALSALPREPHQ